MEVELYLEMEGGRDREGWREGRRGEREVMEVELYLEMEGGRDREGWREGKKRREGGDGGRALFRDGGREMEGGRERRAPPSLLFLPSLPPSLHL